MAESAAKKRARAVSHRRAEARWVKSNLRRHQSAARDYYRKNKAKVLAQKRASRTSGHRAALAANRARTGGGALGRPRKY